MQTANTTEKGPGYKYTNEKGEDIYAIEEAMEEENQEVGEEERVNIDMKVPVQMKNELEASEEENGGILFITGGNKGDTQIIGGIGYNNEEDKDNMEISGYVKVEVRNGTSINEYLKWANDKLEEYIVGWLSPDRDKEMQELANKYGVKIEVKDRESFNKAHKLISLKTHPDKVGKNELNDDFITATKIKEGVNEHFNITEKLYAPAVDVIQKANLGIKIGDASIELVRATYDPSVGNVVKATTGMISTTALYMGKSGIMNYTLPIEMGYKIYEEDYMGAASSAVSGVATIFAYSALCGSMPVLSIPLTAGMTVYSGYSMLKNGYNLYNELNEEKGESNQFSIYDESLINSREIESIPDFVQDVYLDL